MQSVVQYTRIFARALFTGIGAEVQPQWGNHQQQRRKQNLQLVTASSGISKTQRTSQFAKKWSFGDDACFVATHKLADVIGKIWVDVHQMFIRYLGLCKIDSS